MKTLNIILRIALGLILFMPILGAVGIFPPPTADMYNTPEAFAFIVMLTETAGYVSYMITIVFVISLVLVIMNKMALVALLLLPIVVNIVSFHLFLDGGLFTVGAIMGNALALLNIYFLWQNWGQYKQLWNKSGAVQA